MNNVVITTVLIPGFVSVLLFLVFTYLYEQSRQQYFRAWQLAWAAYSLHYVLDAFPSSSLAFFISELFLVAMALCIFVSTRMMRGPSQFRWYDAAVGAVGVILALLTLHGHILNGAFYPDGQRAAFVRPRAAVAARHRHGGGAVRKPAQCRPGKHPRALDPGG